ncbi:MAG: HDOD domain-containing protein [Thermodesulfobacteriota bacterium]|nr:HDOD domain-containing protein [Thermodesulfobacteriota bacterium]
METEIIPKEILKKIRRIPPLSRSASQLITLLGDPDHNVGQVVRIVECDAGLTTHILKVVNSASFSLMAPTTSIARAVSYMGGKMIVGIAIDFCTTGLFAKSLKGYESEQGALWDHNLRTAIAAKEIAELSGGAINPDLAFTCGILHDIGKAVISEFLKDSAGEIVAGIDGGTVIDYLAAEQKRLGADHCIAGSKLAVFWGLPEPIPEVIRCHHYPATAQNSNRPLVYAVHLGDIIAMMGGTGTGADSMQYRLDAGYTDYIDISPDALAQIMLHVEDEFSKTKSSLFGEKS